MITVQHNLLFMGIIYNEQKGDTPFWCISNSLFLKFQSNFMGVAVPHCPLQASFWFLFCLVL